MRPSKSLVASAAAAAILSVIGLAYAETSPPVGTGDTAQMQAQAQAQARNDAPTDPAGILQSSDTPAGAMAVVPATAEPGTATGGPPFGKPS